MAKGSRVRVPKLRFTAIRGIGWHVAYRDPQTQHSRRHRFYIRERERETEARILYHAWVAKYLGTDTGLPTEGAKPSRQRPASGVLSGSLIEVGASLIAAEKARVRKEGEPRRRGSIDRRVFTDRNKHIHGFLAFLNERYGAGAVARMRLADLTMEDVEAYNRHLVDDEYSASQVRKRMQMVRAIIDRAGRPEHGLQTLSWNWNSRDEAHGAPATERIIPTKKQLLKLLRTSDERGKVWIWLGIGLGFGPRDLSVIRVGQIVEDAYDLRREKTGVERYGTTPPLVWALVSAYQTNHRRRPGDLLFTTRNGEPLVHGRTNAVTQWFQKLREEIGESKESLSGFYAFRHLGATEFGSRPGTSISDVKRWLGHSASSNVADLYMRPVRPEYREVMDWVRKCLNSTDTEPERRTKSEKASD